MNPLRKSFTVTDREGVSYALSLEMADFSFAQREIGVALVPFGDTEFWRSLEVDPMYTNVVLLYVGLRRAQKGITLDWLVDRFPTEMMLTTVAQTLGEALQDFSQRIEALSSGAQTKTSQSPQVAA